MSYKGKYKIIKELAIQNKIYWTSHGIWRMIKRKITRREVIECLINSEVIEEYCDDKPFPSCLICSDLNNKILHVVVAVDSDTIHIITAYKPNNDYFENNFRVRRKKDVR